MIVDNSGNLVEETIDPTAKRSFVIGNSQKIISILRDKLYADPIKTIVQEISSNAKDANTEAGRPNLPIKIKLPDVYDAIFSIQDNGIGISPDRMFNVFIQYGNSTKDTDNKAIGGLGIGAKSPFSYSDNFQIETITVEDNKHIKRMYHAYLGNGDEGTLIEIACMDTEEETGTKISLTIKPEDFRKLRNEVKQQFSWWEIKPIIVNDLSFSYYERRITHRINQSCHIEENFLSRASKFLLLINEIPYEIEIHRFNTTFDKLKDTLVLTATYNDVVLTANRDSLDYREKTLTYIQKALDCSAKEFYDWVNSKINNESTYVKACKQARIFVNQLFSSSSEVYDNENFMYKGYKLLDCYSVDWEIKKHYRQKVRKLYIDSDSHKADYQSIDRISPDNWDTELIIIDDLKDNTNKTKKYLYLLFGGKIQSELTEKELQKQALIISKEVNEMEETLVGSYRHTYKYKVTDKIIPFRVYEDLKRDFGLDTLWNVVYLSSLDVKLIRGFDFFKGRAKPADLIYVSLSSNRPSYKDCIKFNSFSSLETLTTYLNSKCPYVYVKELSLKEETFDIGGGKILKYSELRALSETCKVAIIIVRKNIMLPFFIKSLNSNLEIEYEKCKDAFPSLPYELTELKFSLKKIKMQLGERHPFYKFAKYIMDYRSKTIDAELFEKKQSLLRYWIKESFNENKFPEKYFELMLKMYPILLSIKNAEYNFSEKFMSKLATYNAYDSMRNQYRVLPLS